MKKWIFSFLLLVLSLAAPAQAQTEEVQDGYWLHEGRIMQLRKGQLEPLTEQVALPNGLTLLPNGELVTRQGVRRSLQQGQAIDDSGRILFPQTQRNGTVILVPRSAYIPDRDPGQGRQRVAGRPAARPAARPQSDDQPGQSRLRPSSRPSQAPQGLGIRPQQGGRPSALPRPMPGVGRGRSHR
ncbi:MAG: DUF6799 domain-containing protein [Adhaeribacter sp.]